MVLRRLLTRCGWVLLLASVVRAERPGTVSAPDYAQGGLPDPAGADAFLERFRRSASAEPTYLEFDLHALPRRGEEQVFPGKLWTARDPQGPVFRIVLTDAAGARHPILVQSGPAPAVWTAGATGVSSVGVGALFQPLVPGAGMTAFDLQMPFFYWPDAKLVKVTRVRGRPAYLFIFRPPADFAQAHPDLAGVRAYLDTEYAAPVQTELFGPNGRSTKTLSLVDLKKVGERWIPKDIDVRDEATRDKTRFTVTGFATGDYLARGIFSPDRLTEDVPPGERYVKIDP
jgi:hypothetical protein